MTPGSTPGPVARARQVWHPLWFVPLLLGAGLAVCVRFAPYHVPPSDAGAVLTAAAKILRGGVFYRDIDAYPLPGAPWLLAFCMRVFGEHLGVARGLAALVFLGILAGLYASALRLVGPRRAALFGLAFLGFKFLAWPALTSYFYWDLAFCFAAACAALLLAERPRALGLRLGAAGACAGLALVAKQNLGLYLAAAAAGAIAWPELAPGVPRARRGRALAAFTAGLALPVGALVAWAAAHGVLGAMLHSAFVRPFTGYAPTSAISFLEPLRWWELGRFVGQGALAWFPLPYWWMLMRGELPGVAGNPYYWLAGEVFARGVYTAVVIVGVSAVVFALRSLRRERSDEERRLLSFAALSGATFLSAFPRADFTHVVSVLPMLLLLGYALWARWLPEAAPGSWARAVRSAEAVLVVAFVALLGVLTLRHQAHVTRHVVLERADLLVYEDAWFESIVRFVEDEVPPGEPIFVYGNDAYYYFLTGRFHAWPFSQLYPGQTGSEGGRELAALLRQDPPRLIVRGILEWPGLPSIPSYVPAVDRFVRTTYERDDRLFERYPLPKAEPPPDWVASVLRPRAGRPTREPASAPGEAE